MSRNLVASICGYCTFHCYIMSANFIEQTANWCSVSVVMSILNYDCIIRRYNCRRFSYHTNLSPAQVQHRRSVRVRRQKDTSSHTWFYIRAAAYRWVYWSLLVPWCLMYFWHRLWLGSLAWSGFQSLRRNGGDRKDSILKNSRCWYIVVIWQVVCDR